MVRWIAVFVLAPVLEQVPAGGNHPAGPATPENPVSGAAYPWPSESPAATPPGLVVRASAQEGFQLPSGNIHCALWDGRLRCDALAFAYPRPPRPRDCDLDWGGAIEMGARGAARLVCHGDTVANPAAPVLGYGQAWRGPGMTCTAATTGLRCTNAEGHGFELARARLRLF